MMSSHHGNPRRIMSSCGKSRKSLNSKWWPQNVGETHKHHDISLKTRRDGKKAWAWSGKTVTTRSFCGWVEVCSRFADISRLVSVHAGVSPVPYGQVALIVLKIVEISPKQAFLQDLHCYRNSSIHVTILTLLWLENWHKQNLSKKTGDQRTLLNKNWLRFRHWEN